MRGCAGGGAVGEREEEEEKARKSERVPRRIDGERGMRWRRKAVEEATKRGVRGRGATWPVE